MDFNILGCYWSTAAVQITIPATGTVTRLSALIAAGTLLTTAADLKAFLTKDPRGVNLTATQITTLIAQCCGQVIIENPSAAFKTDWQSPHGSGAITRAANALYQTNPSLDGPRKTYVSAAATAFTAIAICNLLPLPFLETNDL